MLSSAPLYKKMARGPKKGKAYWVHTQDNIRLRVASWKTGNKGTVLLFPGRTEYIEKYGLSAKEFGAMGYSTLCVDWRGQGLSDRLLPDRNVGHVYLFSDYQIDVAAVLEAAKTLSLPKPFFLVAHSMGGCIGLRAIMEGLPVKAASFSAPMWGIKFNPPIMRVFAWILSTLLHPLKIGRAIVPGADTVPYTIHEKFESNGLSRDAKEFAVMGQHLRVVPDLCLSGPSSRWLNEALREMLRLHKKPSPNLPSLCFMGTSETTVKQDRILNRMARWDNGNLTVCNGAKHEIMMELPHIREQFYTKTAQLFDAYSDKA